MSAHREHSPVVVVAGQCGVVVVKYRVGEKVDRCRERLNGNKNYCRFDTGCLSIKMAQMDTHVNCGKFSLDIHSTVSLSVATSCSIPVGRETIILTLNHSVANNYILFHSRLC